MSDDTQQEIPTGNGAPTHSPGGRRTVSDTVPRFRLDEMSEHRVAADEKATRAETSMEKMKAQLEAVTGELQALQSTHTQELHLVEIGFSAPSVRRFFRREYNAAAGEMGEEAPVFNEWLDSVKEDPLYAVHFEHMTGQRQAETAAPTKKASTTSEQERLIEAVRATLNGNPEQGTQEGVTHSQREYDVNELRRIRAKNNGTLGDQKEQILSTLRAQGVIK